MPSRLRPQMSPCLVQFLLIKNQLLESLIVEELLFQKAKRFGVRISDQELNDYIARLASNNNLTLDEFISEVSSQENFQIFVHTLFI